MITIIGVKGKGVKRVYPPREDGSVIAWELLPGKTLRRLEHLSGVSWPIVLLERCAGFMTVRKMFELD